MSEWTTSWRIVSYWQEPTNMRHELTGNGSGILGSCDVLRKGRFPLRFHLLGSRRLCLGHGFFRVDLRQQFSLDRAGPAFRLLSLLDRRGNRVLDGLPEIVIGMEAATAMGAATRSATGAVAATGAATGAAERTTCSAERTMRLGGGEEDRLNKKLAHLLNG